MEAVANPAKANLLLPSALDSPFLQQSFMTARVRLEGRLNSPPKPCTNVKEGVKFQDSWEH